MADYDSFGEFYDAVMGDRAESSRYLEKLIGRAFPTAKRVLELGCGTGSVLKHLAKHYEVSGIDRSGTMLSIARKKVPQAKLSRQDMVRFRLNERFDVICCVYDSINHVVRFADWKRLFASVNRHLSEHGVFIFDINTKRKLDRLIGERPWAHEFENNLLLIKVTGLPGNVFNWNIKVFERVKGSRYLLHEENIREAAFPVREIESALSAHFGDVEIADPDRRRASAESERLYFICKK